MFIPIKRANELNREYLKYAVTLWAVAIACLFGGIALEHWILETIAVILFVLGYCLVSFIPETSHGKEVETKKGERENAT